MFDYWGRRADDKKGGGKQTYAPPSCAANKTSNYHTITVSFVAKSLIRSIIVLIAHDHVDQPTTDCTIHRSTFEFRDTVIRRTG